MEGLNLHVVVDVRNIARAVRTTVNAGMLRSKAIVIVFSCVPEGQEIRQSCSQTLLPSQC